MSLDRFVLLLVSFPTMADENLTITILATHSRSAPASVRELAAAQAARWKSMIRPCGTAPRRRMSVSRPKTKFGRAKAG